MQIEPSSTKVAILVKGDRIGALRLDVGTGGTLLSLNNEGKQLQSSPCQTPTIGRQLFADSMATSVDLGWRVGFLGTPNDAANS
jgi:hypothetical protein